MYFEYRSLFGCDISDYMITAKDHMADMIHCFILEHIYCQAFRKFNHINHSINAI